MGVIMLLILCNLLWLEELRKISLLMKPLQASLNSCLHIDLQFWILLLEWVLKINRDRVWCLIQMSRRGISRGLTKKYNPRSKSLIISSWIRSFSLSLFSSIIINHLFRKSNKLITIKVKTLILISRIPNKWAIALVQVVVKV